MRRRWRIGWQHPDTNSDAYAYTYTYTYTDAYAYANTDANRQFPDQRIQPFVGSTAAWRIDAMERGLQRNRGDNRDCRYRDRY